MSFNVYNQFGINILPQLCPQCRLHSNGLWSSTVSNTDTDVSNADTDVSNADADVSNADTDVSNTDTDVSNANIVVSNADTDVSNADTDVSKTDYYTDSAQNFSFFITSFPVCYTVDCNWALEKEVKILVI